MRTPDEIARSIARRSSIKDPNSDAFVRSGRAAAETIARHLQALLPPGPARVLDFGCASGRVLIPLARKLPEIRFAGTDIDAEAVEYVRLTAPENVETSVNSYEGRLPYEDGSFDAVYAVSVWSHLPERLSDHWLAEVRRVLEPDGVALISVGGEQSLENWRKSHVRWREVTLADYEREGFLYREFPNLESSPDAYPGVTESWGNTLVHPDYIRRIWGRIFDVLAIEPRGMNGNQDLVVLRKPTG